MQLLERGHLEFKNKMVFVGRVAKKLEHLLFSKTTAIGYSNCHSLSSRSVITCPLYLTTVHHHPLLSVLMTDASLDFLWSQLMQMLVLLGLGEG